MKRLARAIEVLAWAAFFAVAAIVLALRFWLLPNIERYREDIVAAVSRTVGQPVQIGRIEAGWLGWNPQVSLYDVRILDAQGREALVLPAVENSVAWRSLLVGELRMHSLAIEGPKLSVRRDPAGALFVAGMRVLGPGGGAREAGFADWALEQFEIVVRNAEIEWHDELRGAPPLALSNVNFRLRSLGWSHSVGLSARPPAALGASLEVRADLAGHSLSDPAGWRGRVFAELGYTDLAAWRRWVDYPFDLREGQGAIRLWTTVEGGTPVQATADVELANVVAQLGEGLAPLELAQVSGRIEGARRDGAIELAGRNLALAPARGARVPATDFRLTWKPAGREPEQGSLTAKVLDLQALAELGDVLPVPAAARARMKEAAPRGRLQDARLEWTGSLSQPAKLAGRARFSGLAMNAVGELPGFSGLAGSIDGSEARGTLALEAKNVALELPRLFPEPRLAFDSFVGQLTWEGKGPKGEAGGLSLRIGSLAFANADLEGRLSGTYATPGYGPGTVNLTADIRRAEGEHIERYLPAPEIIGPATRRYLARAILSGKGSDGKLRVRGDLRDFPFKDPAKGEFHVTARVREGRLDLGEGWPRVENIEAELLFDRDRMEITGRSGTVYGAKLANVRVAIPELSARHTHLIASGEAEGAIGEFLKFVESSPVQRLLGGFTDGMVGVGRGRLALKMDIPLETPDPAKLVGDFSFTASSFSASPRLPPIERASARLSFTESTLGVHEARGRLFGGPLAVSGGSKRGGGIEIVARGDASIAALQPLLDHPGGRLLSGAAPYTATFTVRDGRPRLVVESSLRGVASALPPPFAKGAAEALPLRVDVVPGETERDRISIHLGELAQAEVLRRRDAGRATMALSRAALWLSPVPGEQVRLPERPGLLVYGSLPALDAERWMQLFSSDGAPAAAPAGPALATTLDLKVGVLEAYGRKVHDLALRAGVDGGGWSARVQAREIDGELSYRADGGGQVVARLAHLTLPGAPEAAKGGAATTDAPRGARLDQLPAIDLIAERFTLKDKQLGRVELLAVREAANWRINKLSVVNPDATLTGSGLWRAGAVPHTQLQLDLDAPQPGRLLRRLGYADLLRGGHAKMQASLSWDGDPTGIDYPTLSGDIQLQADDGRFVEVDPGVGKLLSIMSLQMLPRRLTLDFRDVFSKGFQYDRIRSSAHVEKGVLTLKDFNMRGSAADVTMTGQVDLAKETQALNVRVVPQLGDTASTALLFVNPFLYFPAALAQRILKDPLGHIFAFNYAVSGSWTDPKIERTSVNAQPVKELAPQ
ncbi:MAG TPA: YhdP family protein [Burkholderiales bacterium]|nr:YhdP family protein [Burkholderiales bacterium]